MSKSWLIRIIALIPEIKRSKREVHLRFIDKDSAANDPEPDVQSGSVYQPEKDIQPNSSTSSQYNNFQSINSR